MKIFWVSNCLSVISKFLSVVAFGLCSEWAVNIQRDSYASYVGHYPILSYFALAENESIGRERYNFMQVRFTHYDFDAFMTALFS